MYGTCVVLAVGPERAARTFFCITVCALGMLVGMLKFNGVIGD